MLVGTLVAACGGNDTPAPAAEAPAAEAPAAEAPAAEEPAAEEPAAEEPAAGGNARGMFITQDLSNASQAFSAKLFEELMGDFDAEIIIAGGDVADNIASIERAIADGLDVIFTNPNDTESVIPALERAREAGIIVGLFSHEPPEDMIDTFPYDFFAGSDDALGGIQAGEFVSQNFPNGANFVEVGGQAGHIAAIKRNEGFREGIAANIIELDSKFVPGPWPAAEARAIMEDFIVMYGDEIDIVWCHWDNGASGVIEAVLASDLDIADIFIIGVDGNSVGYQQVKDGVQALSVGQSFRGMALKSLELARTIFDGGSIATKMNWVPLDMVTIDTLDDFPWPEW